MISRWHILTARSCFENENSKPFIDNEHIKVAIGSRDFPTGQKYNIALYKTYQKWMDNLGEIPDPKLNHDIAVVTLTEHSKHGTLAELSESNHEDLYGSYEAITAGWGDTDDDDKVTRLHKAKLYVLDKETSKNNYLAVKEEEPDALESPEWTENHLCTRGRPLPAGFGNGDGGSPLLVGGKVVGVNSRIHFSDNLYHDHSMNTHQSVHYYEKFIKSVMEEPLPGSDNGAGSSYTSFPGYLPSGDTHSSSSSPSHVLPPRHPSPKLKSCWPWCT